MSIIERTEKVCKHCGVEYTSIRITSQFCKPAHRVAHFRLKKKSIDEPLSAALQAITTIGRNVEGEWAYDAIEALKSLEPYLKFYDVTNTSTWWRCNKCWKTIKKALPEKGVCDEGVEHDWRLQDTLM